MRPEHLVHQGQIEVVCIPGQEEALQLLAFFHLGQKSKFDLLERHQQLVEYSIYLYVGRGVLASPLLLVLLKP